MIMCPYSVEFCVSYDNHIKVITYMSLVSLEGLDQQSWVALKKVEWLYFEA